MAKTVMAQLDVASLSFKAEPSDRFVYSNYYVPLRITFDDERTPILPFYAKQALLEIGVSGVLTDERVRQILVGIGGEKLWQRNGLDEARRRWQRGQQALDAAVEQPSYFEFGAKPSRELRESESMLDTLSERLTGSDRELAEMVSGRIRSLRGGPNSRADERTASRRSNIAVRCTVLDTQDVEFIEGLLQPDIGLGFLDRTRITPIGFALGEHIYALGLAPGEEVVLEQKTFTKRQITLEEQTEQEKQFDLELASTYTTELQEGMERQRSLTDNWGLNASHTGQYTSPQFFWGSFNAAHTIGYTKNVTEANQQAYKRSVKDSQTASSKVSSRYRTQHKTTFRLATEQGFETTSKRTIKNPNATTPVTLHYFKVLQRLQMKQERYGVRLCWAVQVKDPATAFFGKIAAARQAVIDAAKKNLPPKPMEPAAPPAPNSTSTTTRHTRPASSLVIVADNWQPNGGMSAEYDVDISVEEGYTWDGNVSDDQVSVFSGRPKVSKWFVGIPVPAEGGLRAKVHIGTGGWVGGPGISFQVTLNTYQDVIVTEKAAENTKYADDLVTYRAALKQWQDTSDTVLAAAQTEADVRVQQLLAQLSPVNEMIAQLIERQFPASVRDEMWEIDYWQRLFEWERATFAAYPSWWSGGSMRDPRLDPADFLNASWAKLYLPARVGMERAVLRWIFGKSVNVPLAAEIEARFDAVISDIETYRTNEIGAAGELEDLTKPCQPIKDLHKCLATWEELIPTDGTHIEVVQGMTMAADSITAKEISDAADLRTAILRREAKTSDLVDKTQTLMTEAASVNVHIGIPPDRS